jgi:DNA polymerase-3 subunit alpha
MEINKITEIEGTRLEGGSLPDIDTDFASEDRSKIKKYMEHRFGKKQVCSVGTYMTLQPKGIIKDLGRSASIDFAEANIITSILDEDDHNLLDILKKAKKENKLMAFIQKNSDIFYMLPVLLGQPRSKGIHACAMIVFPDVMEAKEWVPMRMTDGMLISEFDGYELDSAGFLKEDILGIKQLSKFSQILKLIEVNGKEVPDIYDLPHDDDVYVYFTNGWNGDVFQMGSPGLTQYTKVLKPQFINDIIAANALYRPGPMNNHYHEIYAKCKNEGRVIEWLWGTEDITKETYGLLVYQEQIMRVFQEMGGLTMKEADDVRRAIGKKEVKHILPWKKRVFGGFKKNGATIAQSEEVWDAILEFAQYSFNLSHSTAYGMTGYISQWLKVNYPIEYWTVALQHANEEKALVYLSEILQAKKIKISPPDINGSGIEMTSDQETSTIYWGIGSIKGIGEKTADQIIEFRNEKPYESFNDFYTRNKFKGSAVKKQTYEALIASGAFDKLHEIRGAEEEERMNILIEFRELDKTKIGNPLRDVYSNGSVNTAWWWMLMQKSLTGLAFINYEEIVENYGGFKQDFISTSELNTRQDRGIIRTFGGYVVKFMERKSAKGKFARLTIENNYRVYSVIMWNEAYEIYSEALKGCERSLVIFEGKAQYEDKYTKGNQFTVLPDSNLMVLK